MCGSDSLREAVDDLEDNHSDFIFDIDVDEHVDGDYPRYSVDSTDCGEWDLFWTRRCLMLRSACVLRELDAILEVRKKWFRALNVFWFNVVLSHFLPCSHSCNPVLQVYTAVVDCPPGVSDLFF